MAAIIKTVALAGANGAIGNAVLKQLLNANFTVTALTRPESSSTFPPGVKVAKVDYNDIQSLTSALKGQDAVVSTLGWAAILSQKLLIDAAISNGVKRIIPSEYGRDPENVASSSLPVFGYKVEVEQYLKQKIQGTSTTYSLVENNEFFDWDLDFKFSVDIAAKKMEIFDGGDVSFTATPLDFVAKGVVAVLQHPDETANRVVRLHGASMTQNKLLNIIQGFTGKEGWQISHATTADREVEAYALLQQDPSNLWAWAVPFLQIALWAPKYGGDFSRRNDNELLGLKEVSDSEIEEMVRSRAVSTKAKPWSGFN